jgi:hypothetical protein
MSYVIRQYILIYIFYFLFIKTLHFCSISGWWRLARLGGRVEERGEEEEEKREEDGTEILDCILTNSLVFGIK